MADTWSTLRELLLPDLASAHRKRGKALEAALRGAIRDGRLASGTRLPSTRDLAGQLGLARGTVTSAYAQLTAEGYLAARHGSGTTVTAPATPARTPEPTAATPARWRFDLTPGAPCLSAFPRAEWVAACRAGLAGLSDEQLGYPDPAGLPDLRRELIAYLGRVRALTAADVLVTHGVAESEALLAQVLADRGHTRIAVEDPSHPGTLEVFSTFGLTPVPVPVDEDGLRVDALRRTGCRAVVVTAAHQFPLGVVLGPERRRELAHWAAAYDGLIIEDDYDAEHRYDRAAVGPVHALDRDRVAYLGSVSKVLAPALRLGWMVPPAWLLPDLIERKRLTDLGCSPLPQAALAHLLRTGGYDRHLRRTRLIHRRRRDVLLDAVATLLPDWRPHGVAAGVHLVLRLPDGTDDTAVQARLAEHGINVPALSGYARARPPFPGLAIGYTALTPDRLRAAVREMAAVR